MKIIKGFSERADGNMRIYKGSVHVADYESEKNKKNRKILLNKAGLDYSNLVLAGLVHGNRIVVISEGDKGKVIPECDGFVTDMPGIILGVTAADCVPVYFWNKENTVIGVVHAGWRGVQKNIAGDMIKLFINNYKCPAEDIEVEIGPHIKDCHFEVKEDVLKNFSDYADCVKEVGESKYLNLQAVIIKQLTSTGVLGENIKETKECTFCEKEKYFSYRRDRPEEIEAMLAYITIQE
jgi:YfiH family protein